MSYLIDQEAWLTFFAERLQVDRTNLGDRDIRLALALYHGAYLPIAATIELRANELDAVQRYAEFGFEPDVPSFATAKIRVTVPNAPVTNGYQIGAPFVVTQGDLRFIATSDLQILAGSTTGEAEIKAELQGEAGTPEEAAATITTSAGWLRGASQQIVDVTPGRDGSSSAEVRAAFRAYAFNPQALVRDVDHADYVANTFNTVGRALASARTEVTYDGSVYAKTTDVAGHLTLALISPSGTPVGPSQISAVKSDLLTVTVPYGEDALHVVPANPLAITGSISAVTEAGLDLDDLAETIAEAIDAYLSWQSWPSNRHVYAGDIWGVVNAVPGVRYITSVTLDGSTLDDTPSDDVYELEPWEFPESGFTTADITLTEAI